MNEHIQRPELFVPLSVRFITGKTGTALLNKFGRDGPLVWAAYLTACKLNRPPGEISYADEAEGWGLLGLRGHEPDFTLEQFFAFTGRLRKTRRTRIGRIVKTENRAWQRWDKAAKQEAERQRKARNRAQSERDTRGTRGGTGNGQGRDLEQEQEKEKEKGKRAREPGGPEQPLNGLPIALERLILTTGATGRSAAAIRKAGTGLPEASHAKVLESLQSRKPKPSNPAGYVVAALKAERAELEAVRAQAHASLDPAYPDEPDTG